MIEKEFSYRREHTRPAATRSRPRSQHPAPARPRPRDPQARLIRHLLALAGPEASLHMASERPWASATFVGIQHNLTLQIEETGADTASTYATRLADTLPEAEFHIPGHIVADAVVDMIDIVCSPQGKRSIVRLTILTIEDW